MASKKEKNQDTHHHDYRSLLCAGVLLAGMVSITWAIDRTLIKQSIKDTTITKSMSIDDTTWDAALAVEPNMANQWQIGNAKHLWLKKARKSQKDKRIAAMQKAKITIHDWVRDNIQGHYKARMDLDWDTQSYVITPWPEDGYRYRVIKEFIPVEPNEPNKPNDPNITPIIKEIL